MEEAEQYIENIPLWASKKNSLKAVRDFLEKLGNPDESMRIIHVAGTNGKGSVCSYLASILAAAGYETAMFISPHLVSLKERFLINGKPVSDENFLEAFGKVKRLSDEMAERGYEAPAYFEFLFYMFMVIAQKVKPDFVILETGLGGLLDTTNVIKSPLLCILTSISLDHMQYLGNTVEKIAAQKAGILKSGVPVVYDSNCPQSSKIIQERAQKLCCPAWPVSEKNYELLRRDQKTMQIAVSMENEVLKVLILSAADYQMVNVSLAVYAAKVLKDLGHAQILPEAVAVGIQKSYWPGRMEEVLPGVWLDGAHNRGGMEALIYTVRYMQQETQKPVVLMFGVVSDKEYSQMIEELCCHISISHVTIARMDTDRSAKVKELAWEFRKRLKCPVETFDTVSEAWKHFLDTKEESLAFCAGSLYLVGEIKALLQQSADC